VHPGSFACSLSGCTSTNHGLMVLFVIVSWLYVLVTHRLSQSVTGLTKSEASNPAPAPDPDPCCCCCRSCRP
jgi:hypothetical protein